MGMLSLSLTRRTEVQVNVISGHREIITDILCPLPVAFVVRSTVFWKGAHRLGVSHEKEENIINSTGVVGGGRAHDAELVQGLPALLCQVNPVTGETLNTFS